MKGMGRINEIMGAGLSQESFESVSAGRRSGCGKGLGVFTAALMLVVVYVAAHTHGSFLRWRDMKSRGETIKDNLFDKKDDNEARFFRKGENCRGQSPAISLFPIV